MKRRGFIGSLRRWLEKFREDHPRLPVIIVEDGLGSNGPHVRDLIKYSCHFIPGCKEDDHVYLSKHLDIAWQEGRSIEHSLPDPSHPRVRHFFRFTN